MIEEWRDIEGFNGLYKVSNTGRVISFKQSRFSKGNDFYELMQKPRGSRYKIVYLLLTAKAMAILFIGSLQKHSFQIQKITPVLIIKTRIYTTIGRIILNGVHISIIVIMAQELKE